MTKSPFEGGGPARARRTDPETSHLAAAAMLPRLSENDRLICESIFTRDGANMSDIMRDTGIQKVSVSPRFAPLRRAGLIHNRIIAGKREKRKGDDGMPQLVWREGPGDDFELAAE